MKINDEAQYGAKQDIDLMTATLKKQINSDVSNFIRDLVMPELDKKIKELTTNAVAKWAMNINTQERFETFERTTQIQINFVENVIKTVMKDNPISITVNKDK